MSLSKYPLVTYYAGTPPTPAQPYSRSCPTSPPVPTHGNPPPNNSGGYVPHCLLLPMGDGRVYYICR